MKINFNTPIKNLDGTDNESTVGKILCGALANSVNQEEHDRMKYYGWTQKLMKGQPLELDDADAKKLREVIVKSAMLTNWQAGSMLEIMDKAK